MTKRRIIGGIVLLLLLGGGFVISQKRSTTEEFEVGKVELQTIEESIEVPGKVDAQLRANLRFLAGGKVTSLPVFEGQFVEQGQLIASVDKRDLQKNLQKDLNDYMVKRLDFEQGKDNRKDQAKTDTVLRNQQQDQLVLDNTVLDVEIRDIAIKNASLTAPFGGVITKLPIKSSGITVLSTDIFEIVDPQTLFFEAEIDEVDVGRIQTGMSVRIRLDAYPDDPIDGSIDAIGLLARASTTSSGGTVFPLKVRIPNPDLTRHRMGMNGTMTIIINKKENVLSVPISSTITSGDKTTVRLRDTSKPEGYREQEIQVGIEGDEYVEVTSGLDGTEALIIPK